MTIQEAVDDLLKSEEFKVAAKNDAKLRVYAGRIRKEGAKTSAAIDLLQQFGYTVEIKKDKERKAKKTT